MKYKSYIDQGNQAKNDVDQAMDFLESLDKSRYVEFVVKILNDISKGAIEVEYSMKFPLKTKR